MTREEMREMIGGVAFMAALVALMAVFCAVTPMHNSKGEPSPEVCVRVPPVRHTDAGRQEDFGRGLVQAAQAINQVNNNAN